MIAPSRFPIPIRARIVRGFTLIELMVSITILTMIVIMFSQALGSVTAIWGRAQEKMDNYGKARTILNRLQIDLQNFVARDDLPNFGVTAGGGSAFGFYTLQRGLTASTGANDRALSYVEYVDDVADGIPILLRRNLSYSYAGGSSPDFLAAPIPEPGVTPASTPVPTQLTNGDFVEAPVLQGLLSFAYGFLHPNGEYSDSFYVNSDNQASHAVGVTIGMVVADNRTAAILADRGEVAALQQDLLPRDPSGPDWSPKALWDYQLGHRSERPSGGSATQVVGRYPGTFLEGIRTFERTYRFSSSL